MSFNALVHQPARLRLLSWLVALGRADFSRLRDDLGLTDGNLGAHLQKLEKAGYVRLEKAFVDRKPRTTAIATESGRLAFVRHVEALQDIIAGPAGS